MLILGSAQHGVHGMAELVEQVPHKARGQQCGDVTAGPVQVTVQNHDRELKRSVVLFSPATYCTVAVLQSERNQTQKLY